MSYTDLNLAEAANDPKTIEVTYRDEGSFRGFGISTELLGRLAAKAEKAQAPGVALGPIPAKLIALVLEKARQMGLSNQKGMEQ